MTSLDPTPRYRFSLRMKVRDYECDLQGIVNNAHYQHYTEHTRHEFLSAQGVSFADLHKRGIDAVVARMTLNFKLPLRSGDEFLSCFNVYKEGPKYVFKHDIYRLPDYRLVNQSTVTIVCLVNGRLSLGVDELNRLIEDADNESDK